MAETTTERRRTNTNAPRLYKATPRGIGKGWGACMVCGGDAGELRHDCAFFVPSRETGEAIVALFQYGAKLDYRPSEPQWCQVKITACDEHLSNLEALVGSVSGTHDRRDGPGISVEMVAELATPAAAPPEAVTVPIAWICEDLILSDGKPLFTQDREHARRRAEVMHEGKPAWRVTPVYVAAPGAQPAQFPNPANEPHPSEVAKRIAYTWSDTKWPGSMVATPDEFWDSLEEGHRTAWLAAAQAASPAAGVEQLARVRQAITDMHYAYDCRLHGTAAANIALGEIQEALGMPWVPGAEKDRREEAEHG